jgi:prepilin peptidase CpaA
LAGVLLGLGINLTLAGWSGLWFSLQGLGLALLIYFPLFLLRAMGAGDGKLMAAVGACAGPANWFGIFVITAVCGAILGLMTAAKSARLRKTFENLYLILVSLRLKQAPYEAHPQLDVTNQASLRLPHAISIAIGTLSFLFLTRWPRLLPW